MTYFQAYLFSFMDDISKVFAAIIIGILIGTILRIIRRCTIYSHLSEQKDSDKKECDEDNLQTFKKGLIIVVTLMIIANIIPSQKQVAFIYIAPKIVNNTELQESLKRLPNITTLGLKYLEDVLEGEINESNNK